MNRFIRLIVLILVVGFVVSTTVVLAANSWSRRKQGERNARNAELLAGVLAQASHHLRRMDMVVESQQVDARRQALQTTLLVRQYGATGSDQTRPLWLYRVSIPGDEVVVDGTILDFAENFAVEAWQYPVLGGKNLAYFDKIYAKGQLAPTKGEDKRFTLWPRSSVPQLTRLAPLELRPSSYEVSLWNYVWSMIPDPLPASYETTQRGLTIRTVTSGAVQVKLERTYTAYIGQAGISLEENAMPTMPGLLENMLDQAKYQDSLLEQ